MSHSQWSSPTLFVLAASGSVIGLGNIWQFPHLVVSNGGGAFLLVYVLCLIGIGIPLMIAEISIGRQGRGSPIRAMRTLAAESGHPRRWHYLGALGILVGFLLLSYYSVIAGWALAYMLRAMEGAFSTRSPQAVAELFGDMVTSPMQLLLWHTLIMTCTMGIVARGVRAGLEQAARYLVPALFVVVLLLMGYALTTGYFRQGALSLLSTDFSRLTLNSVLAAMEYSFFTLSLCTGAMMIYGAYLPQGISVVKTTLVIAGADLLVSLLAGMALLPLLYLSGSESGAGPGLVFQTLPIVFGQMAYGSLYGVLFYVLLVLAALTTLISLAEPGVAWLIERRGISRHAAAWWVGGTAWLLGIGTILSFNRWSAEPYLLFGKTFFYRLDYLTSNVMLPMGGLLVAIVAGWLMRPSKMAEPLGPSDGFMYRSWHLLLRFVPTVAMVVIVLHSIGVIDFE